MQTAITALLSPAAWRQPVTRAAAGDESKVMMEAHTDAGLTVGEPFGHQGLYDFGGHTSLTKRVTQLGGVMMQHRCGPSCGQPLLSSLCVCRCLPSTWCLPVHLDASWLLWSCSQVICHRACRLTPPPEASYSLHRKLSGAFLACIKLRARVPCNEMFFSIYDAYKFSDERDQAATA